MHTFDISRWCVNVNNRLNMSENEKCVCLCCRIRFSSNTPQWQPRLWFIVYFEDCRDCVPAAGFVLQNGESLDDKMIRQQTVGQVHRYDRVRRLVMRTWPLFVNILVHKIKIITTSSQEQLTRQTTLCLYVKTGIKQWLTPSTKVYQ